MTDTMDMRASFWRKLGRSERNYYGLASTSEANDKLSLRISALGFCDCAYLWCCNLVLTSRKNTGTKKIASTVAVIMPPTTPVPIAFWLPAPAPVPAPAASRRR